MTYDEAKQELDKSESWGSNLTKAHNFFIENAITYIIHKNLEDSILNQTLVLLKNNLMNTLTETESGKYIAEYSAITPPLFCFYIKE